MEILWENFCGSLLEHGFVLREPEIESSVLDSKMGDVDEL